MSTSVTPSNISLFPYKRNEKRFSNPVRLYQSCSLFKCLRNQNYRMWEGSIQIVFDLRLHLASRTIQHPSPPIAYILKRATDNRLHATLQKWRSCRTRQAQCRRKRLVDIRVSWDTTPRQWMKSCWYFEETQSLLSAWLSLLFTSRDGETS
jgi:hypothetical protein